MEKLELIAKEVCSLLQYKGDLKKFNRTKSHLEAHNNFIYVATTYYGYSLTKVGEYLGLELEYGIVRECTIKDHYNTHKFDATKVIIKNLENEVEQLKETIRKMNCVLVDSETEKEYYVFEYKIKKEA